MNFRKNATKTVKRATLILSPIATPSKFSISFIFYPIEVFVHYFHICGKEKKLIISFGVMYPQSGTYAPPSLKNDRYWPF